MLYNDGWTRFNRDLATNSDIQAAFRGLEGYEGVFDPKTRAFLYYITLAENAFNLRKEGLVPKDEYYRFMEMTGKFVRASEEFDFKFLKNIGFSEEYISILESRSSDDA